jgi:hypothetical protein
MLLGLLDLEVKSLQSFETSAACVWVSECVWERERVCVWERRDGIFDFQLFLVFIPICVFCHSLYHDSPPALWGFTMCDSTVQVHILFCSAGSK